MILTTGVTLGRTVITITLLVIPDGVAQVALLVSVQVITSLFTSELVVYAALLPTTVLFFFQT